ncbi:MAG: hypothetical protein A2293_05080 [Elusimicrobia bacterium RIFOXYB2_FULL_49_7]|nr:MAG: hypothetical protein A2293_05080 [Elusimicrobia bacterium RIFOXYB2_FULL_49_7]
MGFGQHKNNSRKNLYNQSRALMWTQSPTFPAVRLLRRVRGTRPTATSGTRTIRLFGFNMRAETQENGGAA